MVQEIHSDYFPFSLLQSLIWISLEIFLDIHLLLLLFSSILSLFFSFSFASFVFVFSFVFIFSSFLFFCLFFCLSHLLSFAIRFSVFTAVSLPQSTRSITSAPLTGSSRCPMKAPCVTCCGPTPTTGVAGVSRLAEQATHLAPTFLRPSTTATA